MAESISTKFPFAINDHSEKIHKFQPVSEAGAVAFSRSGSAELGDFDDAVILTSFGDVPEDFECSRS
jgi:hypothetical protein